jgi:hypothetical protein
MAAFFLINSFISSIIVGYLKEESWYEDFV